MHKIQNKVNGTFYGTNIILHSYQLLKNIKKNKNGIAPALEYAWVGRRIWTPCQPSVHKIQNKVDGMIYGTNMIIDN